MMTDRVAVHHFHSEDGHVTAWVDLPKGPTAAFRWCPGQSPAVDAATEAYTEAIARAVELALLENVPEVPDTPPESGLIAPCRMCGAQRPENVEDGRGYTWCPEHREYARE